MQCGDKPSSEHRSTLPTVAFVGITPIPYVGFVVRFIWSVVYRRCTASFLCVSCVNSMDYIYAVYIFVFCFFRLKHLRESGSYFFVLFLRKMTPEMA